jgi:putative transposase
MGFPPQHRTKLHSTNPFERLNGESKRRHLPQRRRNHARRRVILLEQKDDWAVQRARYMTLESVAQMSDDPLVTLPAMAA